MEGLVLLLAAETLAIAAVNIDRRKRLLRWLKGEASMEELLALKKERWFQKFVLKPPVPVDVSKKYD